MDPNRGCLLEEILFEILSWLPVKSLCRFRCVSKSWLSIISDPDFVAAHLTRSRSRPKLLISVMPGLHGMAKKVMGYFFSIDYPEQSDTQPGLLATSCSSTEFGRFHLISQSPSGLICFDCPQGIKIGNPITGDFNVIPYPITGNMDIIPYNFFSPSRGRSLFFGFDPVEKRQVILNVEVGAADSSYVFDLVDNCWHKTQPHPWLKGGDGVSSVCINGVIYFTCYKVCTSINSPSFDCLYAFDVRLKSFKMIQRPPNSLGQRFKAEFLFEYKGRIALVNCDDLHDAIVDEIKMWILEDVENHIWSFKSFLVPWRKNLVRDGLSFVAMPSWNCNSNRKVKLLGATHRGELILATPLFSFSPYLFFYEIETNKLRRFKLDGTKEAKIGDLRFNMLIESLQSVPKWSE